MSKRRASKSPQGEGTVTDAQAFRRLLHAHGPLGKGLNFNRHQLASSAVVAVVTSLSSTLVYASAFAANAFPKKYEDIKPRRALAPTRPDLDMIWSAAVLHQYRKQLSAYVAYREKFYAAINGAQFDTAHLILDEIEGQFGVSMWLMFSRLSLTQQRDGISAQKAFLDSVLESDAINPFFGYLSFFFSYGLEENVSVAELTREIEVLAEAGLKGDLVAYFRYHASPTGLSAVENPYDCINLEENSPIIDRFETFVEMSQLITARAEIPAAVPYLRRSVELLSDIPDLRIRNLHRLLSADAPAETDADFLNACERYTIGDYEAAKELCGYALSQTPAAAWWYELSARLGIVPCETDADSAPISLVGKIVSGFTRAAGLEDDGDAAIDLQKLAIAARKQPAALCIAAFLDRGADITIARSFSENQALWALSSPLENPKHFPIIQRACEDALERIQEASAAAAPTCSDLHSAALAPTPEALHRIGGMKIPHDRRDQYQAHALYNLGHYQDALALYQGVEAASEAPQTYRVVRDIYLCLRNLEQSDRAAEYMAQWISRNPKAARLFPLQEAAEWAVETRGINEFSLHRAVFLQACTDNGLSFTEGDISDAYEDVLDHFDCRKPSQLIEANPVVDGGLLRWYLRSVCSISRMEDSINFDTLEEIEDERIHILQWLIDNDERALSRSYTDEIASIVKDQEVARLAQQFDRSRIYVDDAGVKKQIDHELRDAVSRYKQLLSHPQLELKVGGIEQSLRRLLKKSDQDLHGLHIPSTERESVFQSLYNLALETFALSPAHGFQTYLSTRILHGSLEGELRSSFVSRSLLFSAIEDEARAGIHAAWGERLAALDDAQFRRVVRVLTRFSERVSSAVSELKDRDMRVKTTDWPNGCFEFKASDAEKLKLRNTLIAETEYDEFVARLMAHLWGLVEDGLGSAHELLHDFERRVESQVTTALSGLSAISSDGRIAELTDAFVHSMTDFSADMQRVKSWFARSGVLPAEPFSLEVAVGVAARITNKCYPNSPIITSVSGGNQVIEGRFLNAFVDLLSNCFHNVAQHSGLSSGEGYVNVKAEALDGGLAVLVSNGISDCTDADELRARIAEKLAPDEDGSSAMSEGGSGLRKIRRILRYDFHTETPLSVEVTADRKVKVEVFVPSAGCVS